MSNLEFDEKENWQGIHSKIKKWLIGGLITTAFIVGGVLIIKKGGKYTIKKKGKVRCNEEHIIVKDSIGEMICFDKVKLTKDKKGKRFTMYNFNPDQDSWEYHFNYKDNKWKEIITQPLELITNEEDL